MARVELKRWLQAGCRATGEVTWRVGLRLKGQCRTTKRALNREKWEHHESYGHL